MATFLIPNALRLSHCSSPGHVSLITDDLASSGGFLLHRLLCDSVKDKQSCLIVSLCEPQEHWKIISGKMGVDLSTCLSSKSVLFVDSYSQMSQPKQTPSSPKQLSTCPPIDETSGVPLRPLYEIIRSVSAEVPGDRPKILLVDDGVLFEWLGIPGIQVSRFWRALLALCQKLGFGLVIRYTANLDEQSEIFDLLMSSCDIHVVVSPLVSGRSSAVTGEITLQRGPISREVEGLVEISKDSAMQYRLTESGPVWIERGTGGGVL